MNNTLLSNYQDLLEEKMAGVTQMVGADFDIEGVIPEMRSMLVGLEQPIIYHAQVNPERSYTVVLGSYEGDFGRPGFRVMEARIEGGTPQKIDVIASVGRKKPFVTSLTGKDIDGDGWLDITVAAHAEAKHPAPQITVLWIFDHADWIENNMTPEQVMEGNFDEFIHHYVDCGSDASLFPVLTYEKRLDPLRTITKGLQTVAHAHDEIKSLLGDELTACQKTLSKLEILLTEQNFYAFARAFNPYVTKLTEARNKTANFLAEKYKPHWKLAAETSIANPWSGEIRIRQEDNLRIEIGMLPRPTSNSHTFHPAYAVRRPFEWIEVATSATSRRESTALGLDYDLGLQDFQYDPLISHYTYRDGKVSVQTMDKAAVRVASENLELEVSLNVPDLNIDGPMIWRKVMSIHNTPIYNGMVFKKPDEKQLTYSLKNRRFKCEGFTVFWADSLDDLKVLGSHLANWKTSQQQADKWIADRMSTTKLSGPAKLVDRAEIDKRTLLSMFHKFGGVHAALDGGYNAIWVRDSTIASVFSALAGDPEYLRDWAPYVIANPTPLEHNGRVYNSFIIAPYNGEEIFKKEDDGPFYAIVSAYAYWKLLDDDTHLMQWYDTLSDSMDFLESHSYDPDAGLYAEYLINEMPLKGSPYWKDEKNPTLIIDGDWPVCIQSLYQNHLMYASNLMMGEIALELDKTKDSEKYFKRADDLLKNINEKFWQEDKGIYLAGLAIMDNDRIVDVHWTYSNIYVNYIWAFSLFPILPHYQRSLVSLDDCVEKSTKNGLQNLGFVSCYFHSAVIYGWSGLFKKALRLIDYIVDLCQKVEWSDKLQALYAMKGSMLEMTSFIKFHRPQVFCSAPMLHGIVSFGASADYNGVNIMPSDSLKRIDNFIYKKSVLNIDLKTPENIGGIVVDMKEIPYTLRIPSKFLTPGTHKISFLNKKCRPLLLFTNLELLDVKETIDGVEYTINGYGNGVLRFKKLSRDKISATDDSGKPVAFDFIPTPTGDFIQITAKGKNINLKILK